MRSKEIKQYRAMVSPHLRDIRRWIREDLSDAVFYQVDGVKVQDFYTSTEVTGQIESETYRPMLPKSVADLFGQQVVDRLASTIKEIEEAADCYCLDRHTACVFHLMRVMEIVLRVLGKSLNDPNLDPKINPSWESILRKCDMELQKPYNQKCQEWQSDPVFFSEATANLRAVKDAWRNPTMHVEIDYDRDRARDVWNAVRSFVRHVATKLSE